MNEILIKVNNMSSILKLGAIITILLIGYGNTKADVKGVQIQFERKPSNNVVNSRNARRSEGSIRRPVPKATEPYKAIVLPNQEIVANKIRNIFIEEPEKAIAVFRSESGLRSNAKGWNCYYTGDNGEQISKACNPEDREKAWSVDCGIAQLNFPGKECPIESMDADWNIQKAHEWKYLSNKRAGGTGWGPWVAEANGRHLVFLSKSK